MLPLGDCCALQLHVSTGGDGQDVYGPVHHMRYTNHALSDHLKPKHTPDTVLAHPLSLQTFTEPCQLLAGRSGAEQKTLTHHALWENSVCVRYDAWGWALKGEGVESEGGSCP